MNGVVSMNGCISDEAMVIGKRLNFPNAEHAVKPGQRRPKPLSSPGRAERICSPPHPKANLGVSWIEAALPPRSGIPGFRRRQDLGRLIHFTRQRLETRSRAVSPTNVPTRRSS